MSLYNKDLHHVLLNELKLRTSPTASVKVLDLLEQLLPPKLTRMSRGRCWLWRVLKPLILWSKHWLVGLFVGDDFWIPFWIKQDFTSQVGFDHCSNGSHDNWSTLRFDLIFRLPHRLGSYSGIRNTYNILYGSRILNVPWALKAWQTYQNQKKVDVLKTLGEGSNDYWAKADPIAFWKLHISVGFFLTFSTKSVLFLFRVYTKMRDPFHTVHGSEILDQLIC